ncbi:MAG: DUF5110 domain-containing protein [Methanotrichaceae archaeon]|nr:DUF5110 domain-containing protein [Methanotrichaceae archaeon]
MTSKELPSTSIYMVVSTMMVLSLAITSSYASAFSDIPNFSAEADGMYLDLEVLDDDLVHFALGEVDSNGHTFSGIPSSPMIEKKDYDGPQFFSQNSTTHLETRELIIEIDPDTLILSIRNKTDPSKEVIALLSPFVVHGDLQGLMIEGEMENVYGLGEQFQEPGTPDGDWTGWTRSPGNAYGNRMTHFSGGFTGNAQFPVIYTLGEGYSNFALFIDIPEALSWDFTATPWTVTSHAGIIQGYFMAGSNLPDLRHDYMELTGRPPVPPKKAFGLWVSEYGYRNWTDVDDHLQSLRQKGFPVDGFVLDLFWYGGIREKDPQSSMGTLSWDLKNFSDPARKLRELKDQGIGIIVVEESYVSEGIPEYAILAKNDFLVKESSDGNPVNFSTWWGLGGMIDWTNSQAGDFWHDLKRVALINDGVMGHWTDLGEPENFDPTAYYDGFPEEEIHTHPEVANLYNFDWLSSIHRGYCRNNESARPFMLSRSGVSGIQRFGAAMWSGDIGSNMASLNAHFNAQMHMSLSGMDYYGSDLGGFWRTALDGDIDELYTQWFANGMALDVPGRPHTFNLNEDQETAPDRIGDINSNLANVRLRYRLSPYVYSLAHMANRTGDAVFPPLVYYYQDDPNVRLIGSEKMIGPSLLVATVAEYGAKTRDVYLPADNWTDYHTGETKVSTGVWVENVSVCGDGLFVLPLYARAGAIIPEMHVDENTLDILGLRSDGSEDHTLVVRVFPDLTPSSFTLYEDDGATVAYLSGEVRTTTISQVQENGQITVNVAPSTGTYNGAPDSRNTEVILVAGDQSIQQVELNGQPMAQQLSRAAYDDADRGWLQEVPGIIRVKSGMMQVSIAKEFHFFSTP